MKKKGTPIEEGTAENQNVENIIGKKYAEMREELENLSKEFEDKKYANQAYLKDSYVQMKGQQFAKISKMIGIIDKQVAVTFEAIEYQKKNLEAMFMTVMDMNLVMMRTHKENVILGNSASVSELEEENSKINIVAEKEVSKKKVPKAKVIQMVPNK